MILPLLLRLLRLKWSVVALALVLAWDLWGYLHPAPPPLSPPRQQAAEEAIWSAADRLPDPPAQGLVLVPRLDGDGTGWVSNRLREVLDQAGRYHQPAPTIADRLWRQLSLANRTPAASLDDAPKAGRAAGVPYVLFGRIDRFTSDRTTARIEMTLSLVDVAQGAAVGPALAVVYPPPPGASSPVPAGLAAVAIVRSPPPWYWRWWARAGLWLALVLALPLATGRLIRRALNRESNLWTGLILTAYALAGWVLAVLLAGLPTGGLGLTLLTLAAFLTALAYNYALFSQFEARR